MGVGKRRFDKTWLILDANYLCHRMFYAMGGLRHDDVATGVVYGFLREVISLQEEHKTSNIAFCFDARENKRQQLCPEYKSNRRGGERTPEEEKTILEFYGQVNALREKILPMIGYRNIFHAEGYEADDLIAQTVRCVQQDSMTLSVIVSSDQDLYQLLGSTVRMWNPYKKELMTSSKFFSLYGIGPEQWPKVKALAGCSTDNLPGIMGIGEKTAAKFLAGSLYAQGTLDKIEAGMKTGIHKRNYTLVKLPLKGCPSVSLRSDEISQDGWDKVIRVFGFKSLAGMTPFPGRSRRPRRVKGK